MTDRTDPAPPDFDDAANLAPEEWAPDMTPDEFRALGRRVVDMVADYMERVGSLPVRARVEPGEIAAMLPERAPERGEGWDEILADVDRVVMPGLTHWQSPNFFAYFPANTSFPATLADLLCSGLGVQGMLWATSPACTEVETRVLDWLADLIGLPEAFTSRGGRGGGVIQGTASEAVLTAIVAARARTLSSPGAAGAAAPSPSGGGSPRSGGERGAPQPRLTMYVSSQAHSSLTKSALIAGLEREAVRLVEIDSGFAMEAGALERAIEADERAGFTPFFVCCTLGTTSSGAVDPLGAIAPIAVKHGCWLHVDAAWAGSALVCPEHRAMLRGVEAADSFNFNPHKWLLTNFDCSAFYVRDRAALTGAMSITPAYLRTAQSDAGAVIDYRDWHVPLGRRFRALKLWFVLRHFGAEGLREHIRRGVAMGEVFEGLVRADDRFELAAPRSLSLVCFRVRAEPGREREADERTRSLLERVNASGRALLTQTTLPDAAAPNERSRDRYAIRMAIGGARTRERHVRGAWELILQLEGNGPPRCGARCR